MERFRILFAAKGKRRVYIDNNLLRFGKRSIIIVIDEPD